MAKQENNKEYIMEQIHDLEKALESLKATYQIALKKIEELCDDKQEMRQEIFKLKGMYEQSAK
jgi:chromosome segregation ATPase